MQKCTVEGLWVVVIVALAVVGRANAEADEAPLSFGADLVVGFGKTPLMTRLPQLVPASSSAPPQLEMAHVLMQSLVLAAGYETSEHIGLGARMPLTFGTASPAAFEPRSAFALGNIELEGEYALPLGPNARATFMLGVALPTAQGSEVPTAHEIVHEPVVDPAHELDRGAIQRAATSLRGFEDEALFELHRLGVVPKLGLDCRFGHLLLRPYAKLESLISTEGADMVDHAVIVEMVLATYVGYHFSEYVDIGARIWTDLAIVGNGPSVAVVEPQLSAHVGHIGVALGGIWPFAGHLTEPQFGGIRALLSAHI